MRFSGLAEQSFHERSLARYVEGKTVVHHDMKQLYRTDQGDRVAGLTCCFTCRGEDGNSTSHQLRKGTTHDFHVGSLCDIRRMLA